MKFYNEMCPVYPWVGPVYGSISGTINPESAENSGEVTLRQFAFADSTDSFGGFFYHCEV